MAAMQSEPYCSGLADRQSWHESMTACLIVDPHFEIERLFGFNAAYGFLVCAAMILAAKLVGALLKRPDSYYDERAGDE